MEVLLCSDVSHYPDPHSHVQDDCVGDWSRPIGDPRCCRYCGRSDVRFVTDRRGEDWIGQHKDPRTDRIVRHVDWRAEGQRLADVITWWLDQTDEAERFAQEIDRLADALDRWNRAGVEDGKVVTGGTYDGS